MPGKILDRVRSVFENLAELSIEFLNLTTPDADLEEDPLEGDECGRCLDLEQDDADAEPSLGATEAMNQAESWRVAPYYGQADLEGEHDGREPDEDFEPSLGSSEPIEPEPGATYHGKVREHDESSCARAYDQTHWIPIADKDLEYDDADFEGQVDDGPIDDPRE